MKVFSMTKVIRTDALGTMNVCTNCCSTLNSAKILFSNVNASKYFDTLMALKGMLGLTKVIYIFGTLDNNSLPLSSVAKEEFCV